MRRIINPGRRPKGANRQDEWDLANAMFSELYPSMTLLDVLPSQSPVDRFPVIGPGIGAAGWEQNGVAQEPNVWFRNGYYHMIYTGGWNVNGLGYAYAANPVGPWSRLSHPVIGQSYGGSAGNISHTGMYIETDTIYITSSVSGAGSALLWSAPLDFDPAVGPAFILLGPIMALPAGYNGWGNFQIVPQTVGSAYYLLFEVRDSSSTVYKLGSALATGPLGLAPTFNVLTVPLTALSNGQKWFFRDGVGPTYGGPWCVKENGLYVLYYHAGPIATAPTEMFRASSVDFATWSVDLQGYPLLRRQHALEVDQIADPSLVQGPGGNWWLFSSGVDNKNQVSTILAVRMFAPTIVSSNGNVEYVQRAADNFADIPLSAPTFPGASTTSFTLRNRERSCVNLGLNSCTVSLPRATFGAHCQVNAFNQAGNNAVTMAATGGDNLPATKLYGGQTADFRADNAGFWTVDTPSDGGNGATGARPGVALFVGYRFFDTTLGKPIWVKSIGPTVWVDATGATV